VGQHCATQAQGSETGTLDGRGDKSHTERKPPTTGAQGC
jgi:hypothetical protein